MLAICAGHLTEMQWRVCLSYQTPFALRGIYIAIHPIVGKGPYLFTNGSRISDKRQHCFWTVGDEVNINKEAEECSWIWHIGPGRDLIQTDERIILIPRNDLFEIRGIAPTVDAWKAYRQAIQIPWQDKQKAVYFLGHFTGRLDDSNPRLAACSRMIESGIPANIGFLEHLVPAPLRKFVPIKPPEALHVMAQYRYVLSLWGNHPFNPRLYRGLEAGSLVFHQSTSAVRLLDDGILLPGKHFVEVATDLSDLVDKVNYYMNHPSEAQEIAETGHRQWMEHLYVEEPYTMPDVIWERLVAQPRWKRFVSDFDVHW